MPEAAPKGGPRKVKAVTKPGAPRSQPPLSPTTAFLRILSNRGKLERSAGPARTHGFVVFAEGTESLQGLQTLSVSGQSYNTCLTARYRLGPGTFVGPVLTALCADLRTLCSAGDDPAIKDALLGDLLPPPLPLPHKTPWRDLVANDRLREFLTSGTAPPEPSGSSGGLGWVEGLFDVLQDAEGLRSGSRLLVFCELPPGELKDVAPIRRDVSQDFNAARTSGLFDRLPERMGMVFTGSFPPIVSEEDQHWLSLTLTAEDEIAQAQSDVIQRFKPSALTGDRPADKDRLGLEHFATSIARLILHPETQPLTIGIQAPWGEGKSSFLRFVDRGLMEVACDRTNPSFGRLQKDLNDELAALEKLRVDQSAGPTEETEDDRRAREDRVKTAEQRIARVARAEAELSDDMNRASTEFVLRVHWNAWRHQDADHIWAGLVSKVSEEVEAALPWWKRYLAPLLHAWRQRKAELSVTVLLPTALALLVAMVLYLVGGAKLDEGGTELPEWSRLLLSGSPVLAVLVWRLYRAIQPVSQRVLDYVRLPDYRDQLGFQEQVLRDLDFLRSSLGPGGRKRHRSSPASGPPSGPKVVVFVDDLDRCADAKVMEVLQTINLILGETGFFVLLAVDTDKIHKAIANHYRQDSAAAADEGFAESYLRKIIQLSFFLPPSSSEKRLELVDRLFSAQARWDLQPPPAPGSTPQPPSIDRSAGESAASAAAILPPRIQNSSEVEDTRDELVTFKRLKDFVPENPRELKRLVNQHRFVKILLQRAESPPGPELQRQMVAWLVFCSRWPDLVDDVLALGKDGMEDNVLDLLVEILARGGARNRDEIVRFRRALQAGEGAPAGDEDLEQAETARMPSPQINLPLADFAQGSALARAARISSLIWEKPLEQPEAVQPVAQDQPGPIPTEHPPAVEVVSGRPTPAKAKPG